MPIEQNLRLSPQQALQNVQKMLGIGSGEIFSGEQVGDDAITASIDKIKTDYYAINCLAALKQLIEASDVIKKSAKSSFSKELAALQFLIDNFNKYLDQTKQSKSGFFSSIKHGAALLKQGASLLAHKDLQQHIVNVFNIFVENNVNITPSNKINIVTVFILLRGLELIMLENSDPYLSKLESKISVKQDFLLVVSVAVTRLKTISSMPQLGANCDGGDDENLSGFPSSSKEVYGSPLSDEYSFQQVSSTEKLQPNKLWVRYGNKILIMAIIVVAAIGTGFGAVEIGSLIGGTLGAILVGPAGWIVGIALGLVVGVVIDAVIVGITLIFEKSANKNAEILIHDSSLQLFDKVLSNYGADAKKGNGQDVVINPTPPKISEQGIVVATPNIL